MADMESGAMSAEATDGGFKITRGTSALSLEAEDARKVKEKADGAGDIPRGGGAGDGVAAGAEGSVEAGTDAGDDAGADAADTIGELNAPESFDPEDPENVTAWDAEYLKDGDFNLERFQKEVSKNMQGDGGKAALNENTYAYLKSKGIGQAVVDSIIQDRLKALKADELSQRDQDFEVFDHVQKQEVSTTADGSVVFKEAIEWARKGAYSEAAQARFDKIMTGSDLDAKRDAAELLVAKYARTDAFKAAEAARLKANRKREPERDASKARGTPSGSGTEPFATRTEWREARKAAKGDINKLRIIDKRAKASGFA